MGNVVGQELSLTSTSWWDSAQLIDQFVLAAAENRTPQGWRSEQLGNWLLGWHPRLPVIRLISADAQPMGWMLGYAISAEGRLLAGGEELSLPQAVLDSSSALEAFLYGFGGRYAVALVGTAQPRFYLDPCGSLSAVYCADQRLVAATPNLIPYDERSRDRVELARAIGIPYTQGQYPLGLTPRYRVERILPNHYLDLRDWQMVRHWPNEPLNDVVSVEEAITEIAAVIRRQMAAIVSATPTYLSLTAGRDSRMLLACSKGLADKLELLTFELGDQRAAIDCDTARRIARRFGLSHVVLPLEKATQEDLEQWMYRIGYSTGEVRGWQCATMVKRLPGGRTILEENIGELARGYWWAADDSEATPIAPERLVRHCQCPPNEVPLARARSWLETLPAAHSLQVLDLFFIEQDLGCWAGILPYAECDPGFQLFPLNNRRILELMLRLPIDYRRTGNLQRDIIAREWPALLQWPFNEFVGAGRLEFRARKALRRAVAALRDPLNAAYSRFPARGPIAGH
jgi:hypothetical protein